MYVGHSTCHASNVPLICNPTTTHVSPQLHLVFDESFTSITSPHNHQNDSFLEQLYNSAAWLHSSTHTDNTNEYHFNTFWMDPPLAPRPEASGRKRKANNEPDIECNIRPLP
jgi:hypothetical protein